LVEHQEPKKKGDEQENGEKGRKSRTARLRIEKGIRARGSKPRSGAKRKPPRQTVTGSKKLTNRTIILTYEKRPKGRKRQTHRPDSPGLQPTENFGGRVEGGSNKKPVLSTQAPDDCHRKEDQQGEGRVGLYGELSRRGVISNKGGLYWRA